MKKNIAFILLLTSIFLFSGCSDKSDSSDKISLGLMSDTASIPFVLADLSGYFENQGVEIEIQIFQSALDRDSALQANTINAVSSDLISAGFLKESGNALIISSRTECGYAILSSPDSDINSPYDLEGKKVGLSTNTLMEYLLDLTVEKYGISDISKTNIPIMPARLEMLRENQIDAATLPDPLTYLAQKDNSKVISTNVDLGVYPGVILFNESFVLENPEAVKGFYAAYNRAVDKINDSGLEDSLKEINQIMNFPEPVLTDLYNLRYTHSSLPTEENLASALKWLYGKGFISELYSYEDMVLTD
ncbi:ABC transporter substrate-binding protein [Alkalibacter saccharofermentans]|uniref:NitT/TauT family transport system substrate-binding protein n=1 Tax=Alkalibacter saccharofermentans DSM 14828 TaxID=1120975 RepID=A0A1M4YYD5_9FIRM|nr:ABC transporter substrate-binding protein [Alkalibacter saccharofermentans]SHF10512.1 NitT/TauT family transport system substrate-binding protein [Alkalibacter saccharofermentans DSM 14828]